MKTISIIFLSLVSFVISAKDIITHTATQRIKICGEESDYEPLELWDITPFTGTRPAFSQLDKTIIYYSNGNSTNLSNTNSLLFTNTGYLANESSFTILWKWNRDFLHDDHYYIVNVDIIRQTESFNIPTSICQGEQIDLFDYTTYHDGLFSSPSTPNYLVGANSDEYNAPLNATTNTYTINWDYYKENIYVNSSTDYLAGISKCYFTVSKDIEVVEKPVITWSNQFPTSTQILDSETNPISLNATSTAGGIISYNGAGVSNGTITPSNAGYGTHTLTAYATTQYGCKDTTTQTIEITHDAGIPEAPQIKSPSSGVITSQDFYFAQSIPTGYAPNQPFSQEYSEMHVCDGQQITISIDNPTLLSIDSIRYIYDNNGNYDTIGTYPTNNSTITYTIPQTGSARIDYIVSQFKTNLGVWGSSGNTPVFVTAVEPTTPLSTLVCGDEFRFYTVEQDQGVRYEPFLHPYPNGTLNGGNDWISNENTYTTRLTDLNNNNLAYTQQNVYGLYLLQAPKTKTITRTVTTKLPYDDYGTGDIYNLVSNAQTCKFTDSITISRKPIVNFVYTGDSVIIGGTTVTIADSSIFSDYTTFDFFNVKGEQLGDTITDTLFVPQGSVLVTAYDNYGCSADTLVQLVTTTNDPGVGLLDVQTSGLIFPIQNNLVSFSGLTDSNANEIHICDGQNISIVLDHNKLKYDNGIDSVEYTFLENGNIHNIGKYHISEQVNYTVPLTNGKRVDTLFTQLFTILDSSGFKVKTPVYVSYAYQRESSSQILNCDEDLNYTSFIGQNSNDFDGLMNWSYQGSNADFTTFSTEFRDVNGNIQFHSGLVFNYSLVPGTKVDTIFKREITRVPFKNNTNNTYYNAIQNPQECIYDDTIIIVRPPQASYIFNGPNQIEAGTPVRHISTSLYSDSITWDFNDESYIYTGDTMWHYIYDIGYNDITIIAYDKYGCSDTLNDLAYIEVIDWTGINEESEITSIKSYPNPVNNILNIEVETKKEQEVITEIYTLKGELVNSQFYLLQAPKTKHVINLDNLSPGIYNCIIKGEGINFNQKIIKL